MARAGKATLIALLTALLLCASVTGAVQAAADEEEVALVKFPRVLFWGNILWGDNRFKPGFIGLSQFVEQELDKYHCNGIAVFPWLNSSWFYEDYGQNMAAAMNVAAQHDKLVVFDNSASSFPLVGKDASGQATICLNDHYTQAIMEWLV